MPDLHVLPIELHLGSKKSDLIGSLLTFDKDELRELGTRMQVLNLL